MRKLLRITTVAGYRGQRYHDEKSLPREALVSEKSDRFLGKIKRVSKAPQQLEATAGFYELQLNRGWSPYHGLQS